MVQPDNTSTSISVNSRRIEALLAELSRFGLNAAGGIDRSFGTEADLAAREYLQDLVQRELGAAVTVDAAANLWAHLAGSEDLPAIAIGSHHDTVPNGGKYDGALGIILAIEVLKTIRENGIVPRHPLAWVSFTAEEPNPFNLSTFGSRSATGKLTSQAVKDVRDPARDLPLGEALARAGGSVADLDGAKLKPGQLAAFIECHIEQGLRLEKQGLPLAAVTRITGIYREIIRVVGEANHAGTTEMPDRHDALLAASELCLAFEKVIKNAGRADVVGTIGRFAISPNAVNIIPGEAVLTAELRTPEHELTQSVVAAFTADVQAIQQRRGVRIERTVILDQAAVAMDDIVLSALAAAAEEEAGTCPRLASMAGHDATHLAGVCRAGMLFVRSPNGKSHCPEEHSNLEDIVKAGNTLLTAILCLDKELE